MIKSLTACTCALVLTTSLAFAQTSQPQGGANQSPLNPTSETAKDKAGMKKGTTGMSTTHKEMKKDGMKKDSMKNDNMKMDRDGMKK